MPGRMRWLIAFAVIACASVPAWAQDPQPYTEIRVRLYPSGSSTVASESPSIPLTPPVVTCGQDPLPPATGLIVNPTLFQFDDQAQVGKVCRLDLTGAKPADVPAGAYDLVLVGVRSGERSVDSNRVPIALGTVTVIIRAVSGVGVIR